MTRAQIADDVVNDIKRRLSRLTTATIAGYMISIVIAAGAGYFGNATREGACALRGDIERRVTASERYLLEHPDKLSQLGLTKSQLAKEIENQRRTVESLRVVPCF